MSGSFCSNTAKRNSTFRSTAAAVSTAAGGEGEIVTHREQPWSSESFSGSRHSFTWAFDGFEAVEAGELMFIELTESEIAVPGHQVVEVSVTAIEHRSDPPRLVADLELLLLEDQ